MPTPAVKNSKINNAMPMTNSKNAIGGLATVCSTSSNSPSPLNTGRRDVLHLTLVVELLHDGIDECPSIVWPSIASTMLRTVGTP